MNPPVWGNEGVDPSNDTPLQQAKQEDSRLAQQLVQAIVLVAAFVVTVSSAFMGNWPVFWVAASVTTLIVAWTVVGVVKRFYDYYIDDRW